LRKTGSHHRSAVKQARSPGNSFRNQLHTGGSISCKRQLCRSDFGHAVAHAGERFGARIRLRFATREDAQRLAGGDRKRVFQNCAERTLPIGGQLFLFWTWLVLLPSISGASFRADRSSQGRAVFWRGVSGPFTARTALKQWWRRERPIDSRRTRGVFTRKYCYRAIFPAFLKKNCSFQIPANSPFRVPVEVKCPFGERVYEPSAVGSSRCGS
jgi:hypothetical protein